MDSLLQFFRNLFSTQGFTPRDYCRINWPPYLVAMHNYSDLAIWLAYLAIPCVLFYFVLRRRQRLPFAHMFWLFGIFIMSCGFTHFMEFFTFQTPVYNLAGIVKLVTAVSSWGTVLALIPLTPVALSMKSHGELEEIIRTRTADLQAREALLTEANEALQKQIHERERVEGLLRQEQCHVIELNCELEERVRDRTAALQATNQELESFAYSVAHDLRAPLRAIDGFSHMLSDEHPGAPQERLDNVARIREATKRMDRLITSLLKLSRLTRQEVHREPVDLGRIAQEIFDDLMTADPLRPIRLVIGPDMRASVDPNLARVLVTNLLSNAWKFTRNTKDAEIVFSRNSAGEWFVSDNGAGFDMRYVGKLFQPFERLHSESEYSGSGVGLATCQRIVAKHGGTIRAEGVEGEGAAFYFTL